MLHKLRNKIAIIAAVFLVAQLATLGLGTGAFAATGNGSNTATVGGLELVKTADYGQVVGNITDGSSLNIGNGFYSILATTTPTNLGNGSVNFNLDGVSTNADFPTYNPSISDYNYALDVNGITIGSHTLTVTPWSEADGQGLAGTPMTVNFSLTDSPTVMPLDQYNQNVVVTDSDSGNTVNVPVEFNEDMDTSSTPILSIDNGAELSTSPYGPSLTYTGSWINSRLYSFQATMNNAEITLPATHLTISGATSLDGSLMVPFTTGGTLTVDTLQPVATVVTTSPTNLQSIPVVIQFSKPVTGFSESDLQINGGTENSFYDQGNNQTYGFNLVPNDLTTVQNITVGIANQNQILDFDQNLLTPFTAAGINFNPIPPAPVTNLTGTINGSGNPVISWTNPDPTTYAGLQLWRDGSYLTTLGSTDTSFTDTTAQPGTTHTYDVVVLDLAGNVTHVTDPITITDPIPAPVAAANTTISPASNQVASAGISDNTTPSTPAKTTTSSTKTNGSNNKKNDTSSDSDSNTGLPLWGILFLIILAGVGGYLFYSQSPKSVVVPPAPVKRVSAKKPAPKKPTTTSPRTRKK
jgi:hypothetical protein